MRDPFIMFKAMVGMLTASQTSPETTSTTLLGTPVPNRSVRRRMAKGG